MITLFRWYLLKAKRIKWELALWQFIDQKATELIKHPEEIEKKMWEYLNDDMKNIVRDFERRTR